MFGLGHTEILIILVIGGIIFGAKKLAGHRFGDGKCHKEF